MAQVQKAGKLVPFDGTGTNTPTQHLGHGAQPGKDVPHQTMPASFRQSMKTPVRSRTAATGTGDASGKPAPRPADADRQSAPSPTMASATGRGTTGRLLSNNWGAQSLKKISTPPQRAGKDLGSMYAQANSLASTRFIQPLDATTAQVRPANNVHDDTARPANGPGGYNPGQVNESGYTPGGDSGSS